MTPPLRYANQPAAALKAHIGPKFLLDAGFSAAGGNN